MANASSLNGRLLEFPIFPDFSKEKLEHARTVCTKRRPRSNCTERLATVYVWVSPEGSPFPLWKTFDFHSGLPTSTLEESLTEIDGKTRY